MPTGWRSRSRQLFDTAIIGLYMPERAAIQAAWLDLVGVKHDAGFIDMEDLGRPAVSADVIEKAASRIRRREGNG